MLLRKMPIASHSYPYPADNRIFPTLPVIMRRETRSHKAICYQTDAVYLELHAIIRDRCLYTDVNAREL